VFGLLRGSGTAIQLTDFNVQTEFLEILPYAGVLVLVVLMGRQVRLPRALGIPYERESRNA
ncbi:MAG: ABC transporter permease, partial [Chloroflexia bacterium]|nr:ABC transporter permease [Chloroflexia bacterium]